VETAGLHHVALNVRDLDVALGFYVGALGLRPLPRPELAVPGAWLQAGPSQVHLVVVTEPRPDRGQHFALAVADLEAVIADLEARGVAVTRLDPVAGAGRQAFVRDPFGNLIELNEPDRPS